MKKDLVTPIVQDRNRHRHGAKDKAQPKLAATPVGRIILALLCLAGVGGIGWMIWVNAGSNAAVAEGNDPIFINAETGKVFHCHLKAGMSYPVVCPDTGKATGYEAEMCYWTKDGKIKDDPTPVLLNINKGQTGPTFCPECGRLVVVHNPLAVEGHRPPPTEAEYWVARGGQPGQNK